MIQLNNVTLKFGNQLLFEEVNLKLTSGNCYGVIGANGAGKSTFLKLLSGELETSKGDIVTSKGERISILRQDHFAFDDKTVIDTVIMGNTKLYQIMKEKEELYSKPDFSDADGIRLGILESDFLELNGWEAESEASELLNNLGIDLSLQNNLMKDLKADEKVKVLLAQALFGNPDILLLDEPTNHLDIKTIEWLEEFLINFPNTVIVVSHDRHFLNKVCTHILDIDYHKIKLFLGNYDFWYEASQLLTKQIKEQNRKKEEKIAELKEFIARFSANASKSKQATSRKKTLEKIELETLEPSTRKYPFIEFKPDRLTGKDILDVKGVSKTIDGIELLHKVAFSVQKNDKIAIIGDNDIAKTTLFRILMGELEPEKGVVLWGSTVKKSYFPRDNSAYFQENISIFDWIRKDYNQDDDVKLRGFLGRMLFSADDVFKKVPVLSGGEKVRCMFSKIMLENANVLLLDDPTNHLDLEAITSLNNALMKYPGEIIFTSHDHQMIETIANRIIEITPKGIIDRKMTYEEYLNSKEVQKTRELMK